MYSIRRANQYSSVLTRDNNIFRNKLLIMTHESLYFIDLFTVYVYSYSHVERDNILKCQQYNTL